MAKDPILPFSKTQNLSAFFITTSFHTLEDRLPVYQLCSLRGKPELLKLLELI
jgi:hypothetical protein